MEIGHFKDCGLGLRIGRQHPVARLLEINQRSAEIGHPSDILPLDGSRTRPGQRRAKRRRVPIGENEPRNSGCIRDASQTPDILRILDAIKGDNQVPLGALIQGITQGCNSGKDGQRPRLKNAALVRTVAGE